MSERIGLSALPTIGFEPMTGSGFWKRLRALGVVDLLLPNVLPLEARPFMAVGSQQQGWNLQLLSGTISQCLRRSSHSNYEFHKGLRRLLSSPSQ
ncbi:hypothetical protein RJT34_11890 [Clitoria ternatea]|uniref:Uncharacterized protein n=1 Tax=Clitoria ternatea TaxID=43366 RepID=A0AAN9JKS3_CLITE